MQRSGIGSGNETGCLPAGAVHLFSPITPKTFYLYMRAHVPSSSPFLHFRLAWPSCSQAGLYLSSCLPFGAASLAAGGKGDREYNNTSQ